MAECTSNEEVTLPLELSDDAKVAIELYLKDINEKTEELLHKRTIRNVATIGLFTAIIDALLAWTLSTITSGARDAAVTAATEETRRLINSDFVVDNIKSNLKRADDTASNAIQSTAAARLAASEAEVSLNTLRTEFTRSQDVVSAITTIGNLAHTIADTTGFQDAVAERVSKNALQNDEVVVRTSGAVTPFMEGMMVDAHCMEGELVVGGSCINSSTAHDAPLMGSSIITLLLQSHQSGIGPVFTEYGQPLTTIQCQGNTGQSVEAFAMCMRPKR
jgi:hypothetical protein